MMLYNIYLILLFTLIIINWSKMLNNVIFNPGESPIFEVHAILMIPSIVIKPGINELQELMIQAGKIMVGVAKGVGQWSGNKKTKVIRIV